MDVTEMKVMAIDVQNDGKTEDGKSAYSVAIVITKGGRPQDKWYRWQSRESSDVRRKLAKGEVLDYHDLLEDFTEFYNAHRRECDLVVSASNPAVVSKLFADVFANGKLYGRSPRIVISEIQPEESDRNVVFIDTELAGAATDPMARAEKVARNCIAALQQF